jgi:tight adherence protein C
MGNLVQRLIQSGTLEVVLFVLVAGIVGMAILAARTFMRVKAEPLERRIEDALSDETTVEAPQSFSLAPKRAGFVETALGPLASVAKPGDAAELDTLRSQLSHAGYRSERALVLFSFSKVLLCLGGAGAVTLYNSLNAQSMEEPALYTVVGMIVGFYLPTLWLRSRVAERQQSLARDMPNTLDLLVTCVEAGLGIDAALARVSTDSPLAMGVLADEMRLTSLEMRAGVTRSDAMRRLAARTGLADLRYLALVMVQSEMFGTSVAKALRTMADSLRVRRMQDAERRAATASVKMTLPLVLCILPALFTILLGPAAVNVSKVLMPALGGK